MTEESEVGENELQLFVTSTLTAIMKGVADAQSSARASSAHGTGEFGFNPPDSVTFDVAVTAKHTGTARGGFKIQVFSIGANAGGDTSSEASTISRIQFNIPTRYKSDRSRFDR
ncbi:trypco2 family protein [Sphingobium fluviale]|uniref:Trypsin-co-occurring domain-containing protein n=1 Tax=Sphingobium fluviale TaxID=2506423 RepID=A0A4Q1KJE7_9SPHN|nr:trypco2 family protein [Sphingobium fluviale]RXR29495.1 hypothetical protein EQG66_05965 [Sphingobium fluviale]